MSGFSFSFSGDDIEELPLTDHDVQPQRSHAAETGSLRRAPTPAFPIPGQALLAPQSHDLRSMLELIPSKLSYSSLVVTLDDGSQISIPRRELWDVRVQLMAEEDDESLANLRNDDVRTGVYEGGFKSWESSVDVVKVLHGRRAEVQKLPRRVLELGCGTALPSMALFQRSLESESSQNLGLDLGFADYNPTVLQLVTLPNLLLSWAQVVKKDVWEAEGDLEVDEELRQVFLTALTSHRITLSFFSGAWSPEFVQLVVSTMGSESAYSTIIGAETIYSPVALKAFADSLVGLLKGLPSGENSSLVAAKKVYFGVGGSMEDFCNLIRVEGLQVEPIREESDGVRRAVVEVKMPQEPTANVS